MTTALSPRVWVSSTDGSSPALVTVLGEGSVMRFQFEAGPTRLHVGVMLGMRDRPVDVSIQPSVLLSSLATTPEGADDASALLRWLTDLCARHGLWTCLDDLPRGLTGASFPLLGFLYDRGATTLAEVPRWAAPILAQHTPRAAARVALGDSASRRVVAAVAASLLPHDGPAAPPTLYPVAAAIMGSPVLAPDALVRVLRAGTHDHQPDPATWPTVDDIARFQLLAPAMGARRVERALTDAASSPEGARLLSRTAVLLQGIPSGVHAGLPNGLPALFERCKALTPIDPRPPTPAPAAADAAAPPRRRRRVNAPAQAFVAPRTIGAAPRAADQLVYPPVISRLHGRRVDMRLRLVLPRSVLELRAWGSRLHNCLGSFAAAVACGRSTLIGVERDDVLVYCVELAPRSNIRQFLGPYNRSVPSADAAAVCAALIADDIIDPSHPANQPWLDLTRSVGAQAR